MAGGTYARGKEAGANDNDQRKASLKHLRRLARDHRDEIDLFGYHDPTEFPQVG